MILVLCDCFAGTRKGELVVWNVRHARTVRQILQEVESNANTSGGVERAHSREVRALAISADYQLLASGEGGVQMPVDLAPDQPLETACLVKLWNIAQAGAEYLVQVMEGHADEVRAVRARYSRAAHPRFVPSCI